MAATSEQQAPDIVDRLEIHERPEGRPVMHQRWESLLFMHWPMPVRALRPLVPERLDIDTFDGTAWITVSPFTIRDARPSFLPALPLLSNFHEINVRTYVHLNGVPGVWFFSLDAGSLPAVAAARTFFHLPYYRAKMNLQREGQTVLYTSVREQSEPSAIFNAVWTVGKDLPPAEPGSLEFFLAERYCLYATDGETLYRSRIFHPSWPLQQAALSHCTSTMVEAAGLPTPQGEPVLQCGGPVDVDIWMVEKV